MSAYSIAVAQVMVRGQKATLLKLSFGAPAQNDIIVKDAVAALAGIELPGGELVLLNGPASLPVAVAVAHGVSHAFGAVGVFDPKLGAYVVAVAHGEKYAVGQMIAAAEVA